MLWACAYPEAGTVVVWVRTDHRRELEFSLTEARFLTHAERERALPPKREFALPDQRCCVVQDACLLPSSEIRYERYTVYDLQRAHLITECGQKFFGPVYQDPDVIVVNELQRATFTERYRREWSPSERVSHWALWLHRNRRWAGEDGRDEDTAFTPAAWRYMQEVDPDVEQLLPDIIDELAQLWTYDPARMLAEFRRRRACDPTRRCPA